MLPAVVLESADGRNLLQQGPDGGATTPLLLEVPRPLFRSMDLGETPPASVKLWELPWHPTGLRQWWCAGDIVNDMHPSLRGAGVPRFILNSWNRWAQYTVLFAPVGLCLKKGIDRRGVDRHWSRCLPDTAMSTTGLLAVLLGQIGKCRIPDPEQPMCILSSFLDDRLKDVAAEILLPLDEEYVAAFCFPGGQAPASLCVRLPVDGSSLWLRPLVEQSQGNTNAHIVELLAAMSKRGNCGPDTVHLAQLLRHIYDHPSLMWLCKALLHQVARLVEAASKPEDFTSNPVEADRVWGGRVDLDLQAHLCTGQGADSEVPPANLVTAHVAAFHRLRKPHRRWGKKQRRPRVSFRKGMWGILTRYQDASRSFLRDCAQLALACDASRVGGKDVFLVVVLGTNNSGETRVCWAPPQVPRLAQSTLRMYRNTPAPTRLFRLTQEPVRTRTGTKFRQNRDQIQTEHGHRPRRRQLLYFTGKTEIQTEPGPNSDRTRTKFRQNTGAFQNGFSDTRRVWSFSASAMCSVLRC